MKTFTLTLDETEVGLVATSLARMPYGEVFKLIAVLNEQVQKQIADGNKENNS